MSLRLIRPLANCFGSVVTAASAAFPWYVITANGKVVSWFYLWNGGLSSNPDAYSLIITLLVITGAALSLLSRFGGILTSSGCLFYAGPLGAFRSGILNEVDLYLFGFYLALEGAVISLLGTSWNRVLIDLVRTGLGIGKQE